VNNKVLLQIVSFALFAFIVNAFTRFFKFDLSPVQFAEPKRSALQAVLAVSISCIILTVLFLPFHSKTEVQQTQADSISFSCGPTQVINQSFLALILIAPALIVLRKKQEPFSSAGITSLNLQGSVAIGLLIPVLGIIGQLLFSPNTSLPSLPQFAENHAWTFFYYAIVGYSEEFFFRGFLQTRLVAWLGNWQGWLIASTIMALFHVPQRLGVQGLSLFDSIISSVSLLPISFFCGFLMMRTKNILAPATFHTFANWFGTLN
jgi:membrane protease YdiL (CAAX protease family)